MTTITREDLELAALAAGLADHHYCEAWRGMAAYSAADGFHGPAWRPHTDIGDAARLAVHMGTTVEVTDFDVCAALYRDRAAHTEKHDGTRDSKERAYCEAVTKLAAAIGRRMRAESTKARVRGDDVPLCAAAIGRRMREGQR